MIRTGRADLQVHTDAGDGMASARDIFDRIEREQLLEVVAVTDHDDIAGALRAQETWAARGYGFDFVPGIEITTRSGHLLALWVETHIPSFRGLDETIERIHQSGGLAVVPHPFSMTTRSIGRRALSAVHEKGGAARPNGLEVANPVSIGWDCGERARRLNDAGWQLAETGGSDAHFVEAVGIAYTSFPGTSAADLREALERRETSGVIERKTPLRDIGLRQLARQQVRGLSVTPRKVIGRAWRRIG